MGKLQMGYSHIFCIIDMDTKDREPECSQYQLEKATKFTNLSHKYCKILRNKSPKIRVLERINAYFYGYMRIIN